jgi:hypothetical protein
MIPKSKSIPDLSGPGSVLLKRKPSAVTMPNKAAIKIISADPSKKPAPAGFRSFRKRQ